MTKLSKLPHHLLLAVARESMCPSRYDSARASLLAEPGPDPDRVVTKEEFNRAIVEGKDPWAVGG